jgi:hypothetical protein
MADIEKVSVREGQRATPGRAKPPCEAIPCPSPASTSHRTQIPVDRGVGKGAALFLSDRAMWGISDDTVSAARSPRRAPVDVPLRAAAGGTARRRHCST